MPWTSGEGELDAEVLSRCLCGESRRSAKRESRRFRLTRGAFRGTNRRMAAAFPPCPHLPAPRDGLDWRALHLFRGEARGGAFYFACLEYGHALWQRGLAARAMLCLDRAMGADLRDDDPLLAAWPMPYAAMVWFMRHTPPDVFIGNPRVHFQHYADRMNEPRRDQRRWRAWACWALARAVRPEWPADPKHAVEEPTEDRIAAALDRHGHPGETALWREVLSAARPGRADAPPAP